MNQSDLFAAATRRLRSHSFTPAVAAQQDEPQIVENKESQGEDAGPNLHGDVHDQLSTLAAFCETHDVDPRLIARIEASQSRQLVIDRLVAENQTREITTHDLLYAVPQCFNHATQIIHLLEEKRSVN